MVTFLTRTLSHLELFSARGEVVHGAFLLATTRHHREVSIELGNAMYRKLKVYAGPDHPHAAQKPTKHEVS